MTARRKAHLAATAAAAIALFVTSAIGAAGATEPLDRACVPASIHHGPPPGWTAAAWANSSPGLHIPYALASGNAAAAFFFAPALRAGHPTNPTNKILWIVRYPRDGTPLELDARSATAGTPTVRLRFPANSSPGEIYPSIVDLPRPGCWTLALHWATHMATLDVQVHAAGAPVKRSPLAATLDRPLHLPHIAPGARCPVSPLHSLGGFVAPGLGHGPVYPVLGGTALSFTYPPRDRFFAGSAWGDNKVLWIATPRYRGPVLVRGRQLDGAHLVRFGQARDPAAAMRMNAPSAYSLGEPAGWREWPSITRLAGGGCYGYQVDGTTFSSVIVFRGVVAAAPPPRHPRRGPDRPS